MAKRAVNKYQPSIQVYLPLDDKRALIRWCEANGLTMSEVVREEIKSKIEEGYKLKRTT